MKKLLVVGLAVGVLTSVSSHSTMAQRQGAIAATNTESTLQVSLVAPKRKFRRSEQLNLIVMLINSGHKDMYVLGTMEWGYSASLIFNVRDISGKEIKPIGFPDDITRVLPDDKSAFVKLLPNHFLGTNFFAPLDILNLNKRGRYAIVVEYRAPLSATEVPLTPFWGKEKGPIRSNVVWIEVVR